MAGITGRTAGYGYPFGYYPQPYAPMMGYQAPQTAAPQQMMQPAQAPGNPQMTKPTVHADIVQIENEAAGELEPVDAGTSQMMITKDESVIMVKSVLANGETTMEIYRKQPKAVKRTEPEYVTRAEFEERIAEMARREPARADLRLVEPEPEAEDEPAYEPPRPVQRTRSTTGGTKKR